MPCVGVPQEQDAREARAAAEADSMSTVLFDAVKTQAKVTDSVIIAFSGGKESIVSLDLCFRHFKNVKPFFMYICPGLSFQERTLQWYEKKYQTDIARIPHMDVCEFFHYGSFRPGDPSFPIISINDIYKWIRLETGIWRIAAGERIDDSIVRRAMIKKSGSIDVQRGRFYPVSMWKKRDVLDYIKFHGLYIGQDSKELGFSFKSLWGKELSMVKEHFPDDYQKVLRLYPFAAAGVKRFEEYGEE